MQRASEKLPPHLTTAEWDAIRAALEPVTLTVAQLQYLVDVVCTPRANGLFTDTALGVISRVRGRIRKARADVLGAARDSTARAAALDYLADLDRQFLLLSEIGRGADPARAARLSSEAARVEVSAAATARTIAPALKARAKS